MDKFDFCVQSISYERLSISNKSRFYTCFNGLFLNLIFTCNRVLYYNTQITLCITLFVKGGQVRFFLWSEYLMKHFKLAMNQDCTLF